MSNVNDFVIENGVLKKYVGSGRDVVIPCNVIGIWHEAFRDCSLTSITIPEGVTSIGNSAFSWCSSLTSITWPSVLANKMNCCLPRTSEKMSLHITDLSNVSSKFRSYAAVGFAEDGRDCTDENGKKYLKYIKSNAVKLMKLAIEHPVLLYLMLRKNLIAAKNLEAVTSAVQKSGNTELIAAILDYCNSAVSEKYKATL